MTPLLSGHEADRMVRLREYDILDTPAEECFDRITKLAARHFSVPTALISLVDDARQWFKSRFGFDRCETPLGQSFCAHAIQGTAVMVVADAALDERFRHNPLVTHDPGIRFYAGAPLILSDGVRLGTLCLIDTNPRSTFGPRDAESLEDFAAIVVDRMELRRAERELRERDTRWELALAASRDGFSDWDARTNKIFYAKRWFEMLGYEPDEVATAEDHWEKRLHPDDRARVKQWMEDFLAGRTPSYATEYRMLARDGTYRWIAALGEIQRDSEGGPQRVLVSHRDISDAKQTELALRAHADALTAAKERAELAVNARKHFLATISHEIRTPLNGVIGMTSLLMDTHLNSEQKSFVETIRSSSEALLAILNDILDFSKMDAGRLELENINFDLLTIIEETFDLVTGPAQAKGLELSHPVDGDVPLCLRGDAGRLRQVLSNLLSNAVKFTEKGEVVLEVGVLDHREDGAVLRFAVSDTGIGIGAPVLNTLFQPFTQADNSTNRRYGGTGLGLSICKQLVELMGGQIGVESEPGKGSTFWFRLPFGVTSNAGRALPAANAIRGKRLLVVDDHEPNRRIVEAELTRQGGNVITAPGALPALQILMANANEVPFDLALLDFRMPVMDGLMLARAIRAQPVYRDLPLVLLSSATDREQLQEAAEIGFAANLCKPLRQGVLVETVNRILDPAAVADAALDPGPSVPPPPPERHAHLLVAEDNPINQKVLRIVLTRLGYRVDVVGNGREAVEAFRRVHYPGILMDCQMPEMDGLEASRQIRSLERGGRGTVIIAVTANAAVGEREKCLAAGMDDYIVKPVRRDVLAAKLDQWLAKVQPSKPPVQWREEADDFITQEIQTYFQQLADTLDDASIVELITTFLDTTPPLFEKLAESANSGDGEGARRMAHTLRGSVGSLGLVRLESDLRKLEDRLRVDRLSPALLQDIREQFEIAYAVLRRHRAAAANKLSLIHHEG